MLRLLAEGMVVGVALAAPIGPINIEIIRRGLSGGFRHGWLVGLGAVSADTLYCLLIVTGLAPIADGVSLRAPLFLAGAVVLIYLGLVSVRAAYANRHRPQRPASGRRSYVTGFVMAAANPLGIVYWLSIGAALVASAVSRAGQGAAAILVAGVFTGIVCWATVLSGLTQAGRQYVSPRAMRWVTGVSGAVLILFGGYFGMEGLGAIAHH